MIVVRALTAGTIDATVFWPWVSTRAAYSGPDPASGVITTAKGDPWLAPLGAIAGTVRACPFGTVTIWVLVTPGVSASSVRRTRAWPAGADRTTVAPKPELVVLPATTACSAMGAVATVKAPRPVPGTSTAAVTGTFAVSSSAAVPPSGVSGT